MLFDLVLPSPDISTSLNVTFEPALPSSVPEFLEKWPWYRALAPELRALTLDTAIERTADSGEYIARAGQPSAHWYGLIRGILNSARGVSDKDNSPEAQARRREAREEQRDGQTRGR